MRRAALILAAVLALSSCVTLEQVKTAALSPPVVLHSHPPLLTHAMLYFLCALLTVILVLILLHVAGSPCRWQQRDTPPPTAPRAPLKGITGFQVERTPWDGQPDTTPPSPEC